MLRFRFSLHEDRFADLNRISPVLLFYLSHTQAEVSSRSVMDRLNVAAFVVTDFLQLGK